MGRSADWIATEYRNQSLPGTFFTSGVQESVSAGTVAAPTFTPPGGTYSSAQPVTISTTTLGASIRYTTDGSTPSSTFGTVYSGPVSVGSSLTLKAIAYMAGMTDSLVAAAGYIINSGGGGGSGWYNPSWSNRKAITIDHTKVSGASSLANFPVLFSVTDPNLKTVANGGSVGKSDGTDILFTDSTSTVKLNHELESYNPATGQVQAWVQVPFISPTVDTVIYIYYGNALAADQQNKAGVWDSNYAGVWHLPNGTVLSASDSTSNANNATIAGATATTGQIGGGMSTGFSKYVLSPTMASSLSVSWSAWVKSSASGNYQMIASANNGNQYELRLDSSNHADLIWNYPGTGNYGEIHGTTALTDGNWHYLVGTYDGASIRLYVDGSQIGSSVVAGFTPFTSFEMGGRQGDPSYPFNGSMDEVRYSKVGRSADWIATEYRNQSLPGTFFTSGVQESFGSGGGSGWYNPSWSNRKAITIDHTKISGASNLTNFPMLFSVSDANLKTVANGGSVGKSDGTDILFTDSSGTLKVSHELESYNPATGQVQAWVQVPFISPTVDTVIYIYYGNALAADQQNKAGVWDSNYAGVWHLPNGTVLSASDSTSNANNATIAGATATTGQIGGGMSTGFSKYVLSPTMASSLSVSWSAWVKSSASGNYQMIASANNGNQYELRLDSSNHADLIWNYPGTGNYGEIHGTTALTDGNWHYLVGTYDGASIRLYVDGSQIGSSVVAGFTPFTSFEMGGRQGDPSYPFNGSMDEVRYSKVGRSADWIATEYRNQSLPGTFFIEGPQQ